MYYVNYNRFGQAIGGNSRKPVIKSINGSVIDYDGDIARKASDQMNAAGLVSYTVTGQYGTLVCTSPEAAQLVADIIAENPNYGRNGE